jgi:hypothetical protein
MEASSNINIKKQENSKWVNVSEIITKQLSLMPKDSSFYQSNLKLL